MDSPAVAKTAYQILTEAQELIRDPKHWTQRAYARTDHGVSVGPMSSLATCWCTAGAIIKCGGGAPFSNGLSTELSALLGREGPIHTNDDKGHDAVMAMFNRVREKAAIDEVRP